MQRTNQPFLKHLNVNKTPHVIVSAEDEEFDEIILQDLRAEGFETHYVPVKDEAPTRFAERLHRIGNQIAGVNERYAVVGKSHSIIPFTAFGDASTALLAHHPAATNRLCALIAYYPSTIPDPARTSYGMDVSILVHLAGPNSTNPTINITRNQEILGIQGKRKTVRKRIDAGMGVGGELNLAYPSYSYRGATAGFAEHDLEEFEGVSAEVAWGRTMAVLREVFGVKVDVEAVRDRFVDDIEKNRQKAISTLNNTARVLFTPTLTGGLNASQLTTFYTTHFTPSPTFLNARLLSRTIGTDRVVDEMALSFLHDREIPWLLPGIPATNRTVEMTMVSIVKIKAGKMEKEHVYWDQASVLVQVGLLDPDKLPVVGGEAARAVMGGEGKVNSLLEGD